MVVGAGRVEHEAVLEQRAADDVGRVAGLELDGEHEPDAAGRGHARQLGQLVEQPGAEVLDALVERGVEQDVERGERGRGDDRAAGERRAVVAGLQHVGEPRRR